jgi:hypothetical protein
MEVATPYAVIRARGSTGNPVRSDLSRARATIHLRWRPDGVDRSHRAGTGYPPDRPVARRRHIKLKGLFWRRSIVFNDHFVSI